MKRRRYSGMLTVVGRWGIDRWVESNGGGVLSVYCLVSFTYGYGYANRATMCAHEHHWRPMVDR